MTFEERLDGLKLRAMAACAAVEDALLEAGLRLWLWLWLSNSDAEP